MRRRRAIKRKKQPKINESINEVTIAKREAVKLKREETIARVKQRLAEKFEKRFAVTREYIYRDYREREKQIANEEKSSVQRKMAQIREEMKNVMTAGVEKVHPGKILEEKIKYDVKSSALTILGKKYKIKNNVHVIGWGREALMMSSTLERIIGHNLKKGFLVVPYKTVSSMSIYPEWFPKLDTRIQFTEAQSFRVPDAACVRATKHIADYCKKLKKKDILIVLLSRGSDDFMCLPKAATGLEEKILLLDQLRQTAATPREIDVVRKSLSAIRGGNLASLAHPAKVINLVMSDLGADEIHLGDISGGPTVKMDQRASLLIARNILDKYGLHAQKLPHGIREILKDNHEPSTISGDKVSSSFVDNYVVASSKDSLDEMAVAAFRYGYVPIKMAAGSAILSNGASISLRRISRDYARFVSLMILAVENKITRTEMFQDIREKIVTFSLTEKAFLNIFPDKEHWARGLYLLFAPPSHSTINRSTTKETEEDFNFHKTGNNQELAIYFSLDWYLRVQQYPVLREYVVWFLGGASDGHDGNTSYSGAYSYGNLAVDVYKQFKNFRASENPKTNEFDDEEKWRIHKSILPDRVLSSGNANFFFLNVNSGEELLKLGDVNRCTQTRVGDLHIVRIVRRQCSCESRCT